MLKRVSLETLAVMGSEQRVARQAAVEALELISVCFRPRSEQTPLARVELRELLVMMALRVRHI